MSILNNKDWNLSQHAQEFFVYATLGIVPNDLFYNDISAYRDYINKLLKEEEKEDDIIKENGFSYKYYCIFMCAKRAYRDLNRTLEMQDKRKNNKNYRFSVRICKMITDILYKATKIEFAKKELLELYGNEDMIKLVNKYLKPTTKREENEWEKCFHYGQMQKWVNMTLKYMNLIGLIDKEMQNQLDIPLDSYIMKALSNKDVAFPQNNDSNTYKKYSNTNSVKWSRLNRNEYDNIVKAYREKDLPNNPIEWEHEAWIKQSEKEKGVN